MLEKDKEESVSKEKQRKLTGTGVHLNVLKSDKCMHERPYYMNFQLYTLEMLERPKIKLASSIINHAAIRRKIRAGIEKTVILNSFQNTFSRCSKSVPIKVQYDCYIFLFE